MEEEDDDFYDDYEYDNDDDQKKKTNPVKECLGWVTFQWIRSIIGIIKIFQFGTLLMGLIIIGSVTTGNRASMEFFVFVATSAWVFVVFILVLFILDVYQKLPQVLINNHVLFVGCGKIKCYIFISLSG